MSMISDEEAFDLFTFLDFAEYGYCDICGWSLNVRSYGRHHYCLHCVTEMIDNGTLAVCRECGEVLPLAELNQVRDGDRYILLCDQCSNSMVARCEDCGEILLRYSMRKYHDDNGNPHYVCTSCANNYYICEDCGNLSRVPLVEGMCPTCYSNAIWHGSDTRYHYHDWGRRWNFYNDDGVISFNPRDNVVYMGVELEIDTSSRMSTETTIQGLNRHLGGLVHYERDGSLSDRGIEIITMPMTIKEHLKRRAEFEGAFNYVKERNYTCDRHTGLHVHVSTKHLDNYGFNRIIYLLDRYKDEVIKLSRRTSDYARYYTLTQCCGDGAERTGSNLSKFKEWIRDHCGHGIYLNFGGYPESIEFRMFGGTLDITTYMATIEFVQVCLDHAEHSRLDDLREMDFRSTFYGKYEDLDALIEQVGC